MNQVPTANPILSVVMPVFNGELHLGESIESILNQTFRNFEFIIVDDGSYDATSEIIDTYIIKDSRIRAIRHDNMGITKSLNKAISAASGQFIARQDADDVSSPDRFSKQLDFIFNHPGTILCGTWYEEINDDGGRKTRENPTDDHLLRKMAKYKNQFCHSSVIFSREAFYTVGGYDETFQTGQDFELWYRIIQIGKAGNVPEVLVKRRIGFGRAISWSRRREKINSTRRFINKHFDSWRDINVLFFMRHFLPKLIYPFIPLPLLKVVRAVRYRE